MKPILAAVAAAIAGCSGAIEHEHTAEQSIGTLVTTASGPVVGYVDDDLIVFKGIPYAAPPIGSRRWRAPQPIAWSQPRLATADPPPCPQPASGGTTIGSEDCLNVNVWTHPTAEALPVMVFVHGGSGLAGEHYDASALARATGHVVVTVQYRLGALGHLAMPELAGRGNGNFALLDQQAALRWVATNVVAFGGDPARVMLFGESEGGHYTCAHTVAPASSGLFGAAIAQSGTCNAVPDVADTYATWESDVLQDVGCNGWFRLACLRGVPAAQLVTANSQVAMTLVVDGTVLPQHPSVAWLAGAHDDVPLIVGTNRNEASFFIALLVLQNPLLVGALDTQWGYELAVWIWQPQLAAQLLALYPYARYGSGLVAIDELITDTMACPAREWVRAWHHGGGTVWQYEFVATLDGVLAIVGATHGLELAFVFDSWTQNDLEPTPDQGALVDWMQAAWGGFAATGAAGAEWPVFDPTSSQLLEIGYARAPRSEFRGGRCEALVDLGLVERFVD